MVDGEGASVVDPGVSHFLRPYNSSQDVSIFEHLSMVDDGDVPVVPGYIEESCEKVKEGLEPGIS
jgi:agmatinase